MVMEKQTCSLNVWVWVMLWGKTRVNVDQFLLATCLSSMCPWVSHLAFICCGRVLSEVRKTNWWWCFSSTMLTVQVQGVAYRKSMCTELDKLGWFVKSLYVIGVQSMPVDCCIQSLDSALWWRVLYKYSIKGGLSGFRQLKRKDEIWSNWSSMLVSYWHNNNLSFMLTTAC